MFERFTDRSRKVVALAQEEARILGHDHIGTEHILLGLIREGNGVAAQALQALAISLEAVRQQVEEIIGQSQQAPSGHIPFTARAKKVLELSLREALQLGHNYIGTEHILLGLIREGSGVAAQALVRLGADLNRVRQQVIQLLGSLVEESAAAGQRTRPPGRMPGASAARLRAAIRPDIAEALNSIGERLTAIERRLGIPDSGQKQGSDLTGDPAAASEPAAASGPAAASEPPEASIGSVTPAREAESVAAEITRLQALLRQHGIDPAPG